MRPAFTLLEIVLAAAIGSLVVIVATAMFAAIDKTDQRLAHRYEDRMELSRTRSAIAAACSTLVMDDSTAIPDDEEVGETPDDGRVRPPARLEMRISSSPAARRVFRRARLVGIDLGEPQEVEMVLNRPPTGLISVPDVRPLGDVPDPDDPQPALSTDDPTYRGTFMLMPDGVEPGSSRTEDAWLEATGMTLWWVPSPTPGRATPDGAALVSGLVSCQWRAFRGGERHSVFDATWTVDLPSYIEFEAYTKSGIHVNWMFEILWTLGPESGMGGEPEAEPGGDGLPGGGPARGADREGGGAADTPARGGR